MYEQTYKQINVQTNSCMHQMYKRMNVKTNAVQINICAHEPINVAMNRCTGMNKRTENLR